MRCYKPPKLAASWQVVDLNQHKSFLFKQPREQKSRETYFSRKQKFQPQQKHLVTVNLVHCSNCWRIHTHRTVSLRNCLQTGRREISMSWSLGREHQGWAPLAPHGLPGQGSHHLILIIFIWFFGWHHSVSLKPLEYLQTVSGACYVLNWGPNSCREHSDVRSLLLLHWH